MISRKILPPCRHPVLKAAGYSGLVAACLLLTCGAAEDRPSSVTAVFGQARSTSEDVIHFRNNDVLRGKVLNESLEITTAYGDVKLDLRCCAGVSFEGARANTESIVTVNWNRLTGIIKNRTIRFQIGSSGAEIPVRKEKVRYIVLRKDSNETGFLADKKSTDLFLMSNGDLLTGKATEKQIKIQTDYGEIPVSFAEISTVEMQGGNNVTAVIKKKNGDTMRGTLLTEQLTLNLDAGASVAEVYKDKLARIFLDDGSRQAAINFGVLQPTQGESDGALSAPATGDGDVIVNSIGMKLKLIQPGSFRMGSVRASSAQPMHMVKITKQFYLGVYEVTEGEWAEIMGTAPSGFSGTNLPVTNISWTDAQEFLKRLSKKEERVYRLPTEAEWEYACRAGSKTEYNFGNDPSLLSDFAWFDKNSDEARHSVGKKKPNAWGLYDMHGNVREWCADWFDRYPETAVEVVDPQGPSSQRPDPASTYYAGRVIRGGYYNSAAAWCSSAERGHESRTDFLTGFRVVLASSQQ